MNDVLFLLPAGSGFSPVMSFLAVSASTMTGMPGSYAHEAFYPESHLEEHQDPSAAAHTAIEKYCAGSNAGASLVLVLLFVVGLKRLSNVDWFSSA